MPPDIDHVSCTSCEMHALCMPYRVAGNSIDLIEGLLLRRKSIKKGEILFSTGDVFETFQCISAGSFKLVVSDNLNRVAGFSFAGELLDAGAMYSGKHGYNAVALEDSHICAIAKQSIDEISYQIPDFQSRIINMMSEQLFHVNRLMTLLTGRQKADERLAAFLVDVSLRFEEHNFPAKQFRLSMARDDIANYLGLAKCTVSRILTLFHDQGLIITSGRNFEIVDIDQLKNVSTISPIMNYQ